MNSKPNNCPECARSCDPEFIRCPYCGAYILDASPWQNGGHMAAIAGAFFAWFLVTGIMAVTKAPTVTEAPASGLLDDPISKAILIVAVYGLILVAGKWRVIRRQMRAFRMVRDLDGPSLLQRPDTPGRLRELLQHEGLGPHNQLIAYQRICWLHQLALRQQGEAATALETMRHHADSDRECLETSLALPQFLIWLLPTAGFLGTVFGMTQALESFSQVVTSRNELGFTSGLTATAHGLGVAFHTTLVGLAAVIPLLALTTALRRRAQELLEQMDKFFLRFCTGMLHPYGAVEQDQDPAPQQEQAEENLDTDSSAIATASIETAADLYPSLDDQNLEPELDPLLPAARSSE